MRDKRYINGKEMTLPNRMYWMSILSTETPATSTSRAKSWNGPRKETISFNGQVNLFWSF
jgi:hypothetical protein